MRTIILLIVAFALSACTTTPKCANNGNSETIFSIGKTCEVRIRHVLIASKMNLPRSVKEAELTTWHLEWVDSNLVSGNIQGGHYRLTPLETEQAR